MTNEEWKIVEQAAGILVRESFRGVYDGAEAAVFDEAVRWIKRPWRRKGTEGEMMTGEEKRFRWKIGRVSLTVCGTIWLLDFWGWKLAKVGNMWGRGR